jgi:membrane complex biogenesis BtpA family protein
MLTPLFPNPKPVIAMIHVAALPGTPESSLCVPEIVALAVAEARLYRAGGVDGIGIENMHDLPYLRGGVGPEIVAAMTRVGQAVKAESGLPVGVQVLAGANLEAMAVAHAAGLDFIRAEGYVFAHVADEGLIESSAAKLLRYRKLIGAERVQVWADVKKKHSAHAITADVSLGLTAETVEFMKGDAVIVTGAVTGDPCRVEDIEEAQAHTRLPVVLGSGVTVSNLDRFFELADGFIVGTHFKVDGHWANTVDPRRVSEFMAAMGNRRGQISDNEIVQRLSHPV